MTAFKFGTTNSRVVTGAGQSAFNEGTSGADSLTVEAGGFLVATDGHAVILDLESAWTLDIQGTVMSTGAGDRAGIWLPLGMGTATALTAKIGADGYVSGTAYGIRADTFGAVSITNAGTIEGDTRAIATIGKTTITNTGVIQGNSIAIYNATSVATINNNKGTILGDLNLFNGGNNAVSNSGGIYGYILFGHGDDTLKNSGTLIGDPTFNDGNNKFTNSGSVGGEVVFGDDNDTMTNSGVITGNVGLGVGKNVVTNSGRITGSLGGASGDDNFTNSGVNSYFDGSLSLGDGKHVVSNGGTITGSVSVGIGDDSFTNNGAKSYLAGNLSLGGGTNKVSNAGEMKGTVSGGTGVDALNNTGYIAAVDLSDSADSVTNSGTILTLATGSGNDTVTNSGLIVTVDLGDGDDKYTGGGKGDSVRDGNGLDTVNLGAAGDVYHAHGSTGWNDGLDKIDGGVGIDLYNASSVSSGRFINIDNVDHSEPGIGAFTGAAKNRTSPTTVAPGTGSDDLIFNFENVNGSGFADVIYGNAAANVINGSAGNDSIAGYAGNDTLSGGADADSLLGGAGVDRLTGDAGGDTFFYTALSDSGVGISKRDVIVDFTDGQDGIQLTFDANTKLAGHQAFDYLNDNPGNGQFVNFTVGVAGQLRTVWTADGFLLEGDVNGDAKADFQVEIRDPDHSTVFTTLMLGQTLALI